MDNKQNVNKTLNNLELYFKNDSGLCQADIVKIKLYINGLLNKIKNLKIEIKCLKSKGR